VAAGQLETREEVHGMKRLNTMTVGALAVLSLGVLLTGCPKKAAQAPETPEPKVTESVRTTGTGPGAPGSMAGGGAMQPGGSQQTEEQRMAQLLASRGEDIPIKEGPATTFVEPSSEDLMVLKPIYFDFDKSNIRPEFQPVLEGISGWLAARPERQLLIEGHCDERGTDEYNLALGERRALSVRRYLVALGVAVERLHTISYGEEKPADPGHDEAAWAKNRRAEFKVSAP